MSKKQIVGYMVFYDDEQGVECPYGIDPDCEGAIQGSGPPVLFPDAKSARRAIKISTAKARLDELQGKPGNTDFTDGIQCIKVRPVVAAPVKTKGG